MVSPKGYNPGPTSSYTTTFLYRSAAPGNGLLSQVQYPNASTQSYTYNSYDLVASVTDPAGNTTTNTYDADGELTSVQFQDGSKTTYTYDADGNLTSTNDFDPSSTQVPGNPGFENSTTSMAPWTQTSATGDPILDGSWPHSGNQEAWLCGSRTARIASHKRSPCPQRKLSSRIGSPSAPRRPG
jgi:YD repeat-containing protein